MSSGYSISKDKWMSEFFNKDVFRFFLDGVGIDSLPKSFFELLNQNIFIYTKIPTDNLEYIMFLEKNRFCLVDTNVLFEKKIQGKSSNDLQGIRFTNTGDEELTSSIAQNCFKYSRFHLDPWVSQDQANQIKKQWVKNYYRGQRGTHMIVCEDEGKVGGFLQLIKSGSELIVDLIGVGESFQNKGFASKMIQFAENEISDSQVIKVGTQVTNIPSVRLYEKLGFRLCESKYIFHFHGRSPI